MYRKNQKNTSCSLACTTELFYARPAYSNIRFCQPNNNFLSRYFVRIFCDKQTYTRKSHKQNILTIKMNCNNKLKQFVLRTYLFIAKQAPFFANKKSDVRMNRFLINRLK